MRKSALLAVLCAATLGFIGGAAAQAPLKVGILTELSGPLGQPGMGQRDGFHLYLKKNGGKLGGRTVETVIEDTAGDPATAINKAKKLVESDKVDLLIGPLSSVTGAAIKGYVVSQQMPTVIQATLNDIVDGKYIFRVTFTANEESFLHGYLAGKAGYKNAMVMAPNFNAGQSAVENMEKGFTAAGGKPVQRLMPRLGNPDYGSFIGQISPEADVGLVLMIGGDAIRFMKAYADFGGKLPLWGPSATVDETILPAQGKAAVGFVGIAFYVSTIDSPENKAFVQEWKGSYQSTPAWFGAAGYATGQILGDALQRVRGNTADKEALLKAIKETRITGPAGPFRFDANNDPVQARYVTQIREVGGVVQPVILGALPDYQPAGGPPQIPADLKLPK